MCIRENVHNVIFILFFVGKQHARVLLQAEYGDAISRNGKVTVPAGTNHLIAVKNLPLSHHLSRDLTLLNKYRRLPKEFYVKTVCEASLLVCFFLV